MLYAFLHSIELFLHRKETLLCGSPHISSSFCLFLSCLHLSQNQAKLFIEQKKIPFPVDNHNTNEELGESASFFYTLLKRLTNAAKRQLFSVIAAIGYVLIGNGLYDEAIKHFSLLLQVCVRTCC